MARTSKQNIFKITMHSRDMARRKGRGLKFHDNEKWFKSDFCTFFFIYLVGMLISTEHIICRVLTNHDN